MNNKRGIVVVAHGSKRKQSNKEFIELVKKIKDENMMEFDAIQYAFLELADPSIEVTIKELYSKGFEDIYIYPYFLNSGKHVAVDIPAIISNVKSSSKSLNIEIMTHFGASLNIPTMITSDLKTILE